MKPTQRKLKFRVWNKKNKCFLQYADLDEINLYDGFIDLSDNFRHQMDEDDGFILQQFTGLTDKTGREIYEGDIVKFNSIEWDEITSPVEFIGCSFNVYLDGEVDGDLPTQLDREDCEFTDIEVIGNILENPELLEK